MRVSARWADEPHYEYEGTLDALWADRCIRKQWCGYVGGDGDYRAVGELPAYRVERNGDYVTLLRVDTGE